MNNKRVNRLISLKQELAEIITPAYPERTWPLIKAWISKATPVIRSDWPDFLDDFLKLIVEPKGPTAISMSIDFGVSEQENRRICGIYNEEANEVQQNILNFLDGLFFLTSPEKNGDGIESIIFLCKRFPIFVQQLKSRERVRLPMEIRDEYDIQYLFLALLRLHFEDVRKEVWTPNYAGGSSRMDFLLTNENTVLETKMTRDSLNRDSQVGDQLIVDIDRYSQFPGCQTLICYVYDPNSLLDNPTGLEHDLSGTRDNMKIVVIVSSTGHS